jgi:hypothetical protein
MLAGGEPDLHILNHCPAALEVDFDTSDFEGGTPLLRKPPPQDGTNARKKFWPREGFRHEIVCSGVQRYDAIIFQPTRGQDYDRGVGDLANAGDQIFAIQIRQAKVT